MCVATFFRSQWLPCLSTVSLTEAETKLIGNETAVDHSYVQYIGQLEAHIVQRNSLIYGYETPELNVFPLPG